MTFVCASSRGNHLEMFIWLNISRVQDHRDDSEVVHIYGYWRMRVDTVKLSEQDKYLYHSANAVYRCD